MGLEDLRGFHKIDLLLLKKINIQIRGLFKMEIFFQKMRLCVGQFFFEQSKSVTIQKCKGILNKNIRVD